MVKMDHETARTLLSPLLDGVLAPRQADEVEAHLSECEACRAELAALRSTVTLLREVEPVQVPEGFAAAVRGRSAHQTPASPSPWRRLRAALPQTRWSWKAGAAAAAVLLVGIFAMNLVREIAPVSRSRTVGLADRATGIGVAPKSAPRGAAEPAPLSAPPADAGRTAQPVAPSDEVNSLRRVIRTGQLAIEVDRFDDAARRLLGIAEGAGGFVADSSYTDEDGAPRGTFVLRVPAARFSEVVSQVEALGTVRSRQITGQDVTEEYVDFEARVRNLERQEARLLTFMDKATRIPDLLAIEQEVARVRGEIERLTGRMRFLSGKVEMATVQTDVTQKPKKAPGGFWDLDRSIARVQHAFLATVVQMLAVMEGLVAFAASLLPLALLALIGWIVVRRLPAVLRFGR
jgi:hypothetical protein